LGSAYIESAPTEIVERAAGPFGSAVPATGTCFRSVCQVELAPVTLLQEIVMISPRGERCAIPTSSQKKYSWPAMHRVAAPFLFLLLMVISCQDLPAADLEALPEFLRSDPFGAIVAADRSGIHLSSSIYGTQRRTTLTGCRGGYVSFHLVVKLPSPGDYTLRMAIPDRTNKVQVDLFREWFHFADSDKRYYPDALIPVRGSYSSRLPEPDNRIPQQTAQAFWVDVYIDPDTRPGTLLGKATLKAGAKITTLLIQLTVLDCVIPAEDVVTVDHNSYGSSWLADQFATSYQQNRDHWFESSQFFGLIHAYHRIFYEHRGIFHQLGYGHSGKVGPEFAPVLEGSGRAKHITSWSLYDRHYGPLFDGTAFSGSRRGARPIPFVYLPINPEWPASYEFWGEAGYEAEFINVVSEMERHFREKGWTHTNFEVFFNHKKRYKGFPWDGDEVRFPKDLKYFLDYGRLLKKALPDTPVHFIFRADVSWDMEQQFKTLEGVVKLWCASGGILSFYKGAPEMLRDRGDVVWYYGGPPSVTDSSSAITEFPLRAWLWGVNGYVHWLTVSPGADPWFHFDGGQTALVYSGERFGVNEPIPSIRLKIQRNCLQDLAVLDSLKDRKPLESLRAEAAHRYNNSKLDDWWNPRPALADLPSDQWLGSSIDDATKHTRQALRTPPASGWHNLHEYVLSLYEVMK
jgi:hypothetical protein